MKNYLLLLVSTVTIILVGCARDPHENRPGNTKKYNDFDFSTVGTSMLSVSYGDMGGIPASVYFEVYDRQPVVPNEQGTAYKKVADLSPLYAGYTDEAGRFSGEVGLPDYLEKAYIYTPAFYAQTLLEATRVNGVLTATAVNTSDVAVASASTRAEHTSQVIESDGWKTWLGTYNAPFGKIKYTYTGPLKESNFKDLYRAHATIFDTSKSCPLEYRSSRDLHIEKAAEVAITLLGSNTCWNCSMGYYYYEDGKKPTSLSEAHVVMIFPNTQDGAWSNNPREANRYKGVDRGTAVQLLYYPNIASGSNENATTVFPKNTRIGFVLATNAWTNRLPGFGGDKKYRAATSDGLSIDDNGVAYKEARTAVYRYTDTKKEINSILFSFEDYTSDDNFSDVVFTMNSNPVDAVIDIPSVDVDDDKKTAKLLKGIYAFEDLWPSRGDYDMNDVMVKYNYEKIFNEKGIFEESFLLHTYANYAGNNNGLALTLEGGIVSAKLTCLIQRKGAAEFEETTFTRDGNVLLLTANVKEDMGAVYKITATYTTPIRESLAGIIKPFIYRTERDGVTLGNRWEVHLPYEAPSNKMENTFFGLGDDRSVPEKGIYYVRAVDYPFAFFLAGATDADVSKLLDGANEKKAINELYPDYMDWATSKGKKNTDWYKK